MGGVEDTRVEIAWVERRTGKHRATISRWCAEGSFPQPHYLGARRCWWLSEVLAWEAARMARPHSARGPGAKAVEP